jgi:putative DNA primase/helicase
LIGSDAAAWRPESVKLATAEYFSAQDLFGQWLEDECDAEPGNTWKWEASGALFESWSAYAKAAGEEPGSRKAFADAMQGRGFERCEKGHAKTRSFSGVRLKVKGLNDFG